MLLALALMSAQAADPGALMRAAHSRLGAGCATGCGAPPDARWRVAQDDEAPGADAKARALGDGAARCGVVGARLCTKRPRRLLRAPFGR